MSNQTSDDAGEGLAIIIAFFIASYGFQQVLSLVFEKDISIWQSLGICFLAYVLLKVLK